MEGRQPSILIPFSPIENDSPCRDVFVYLRPETNGVEVESIIMNALRAEDRASHHIKLIYLANFPGDYIHDNKLIENHYRLRLLFAMKGKVLFTWHMKKAFKSYFRCSFEKADIIGPYDAMARLGIDEETLFKTWVKPSDMMNINGQSVKKMKDFFVLNYDIPALLNKNNRTTDIAVMIFRTTGKNIDISFMIDAIEERLEAKGIINILSPASRVFHYSKGPFEELLDSSGFLYTKDLTHIPLCETAFGLFLIKNGVESEHIEGALRFPIMYFKTAEGHFEENDIYSYTNDHTYVEALSRFRTAYLQRVIE